MSTRHRFGAQQLQMIAQQYPIPPSHVRLQIPCHRSTAPPSAWNRATCDRPYMATTRIPSSARLGPKRKLTEADLRRKVSPRRPSHCHARLAAHVTPQRIAQVLCASRPPYVRKRPIDHGPLEGTAAWWAVVRHFINTHLRKLPLHARVYGDETAVHGNDASTTVRVLRGQKIMRARSRQSQCFTLHASATIDRVICWDLSRMNASDGEIQRVMGLVEL